MPDDVCKRRRFLKVMAQGGALAGAASLGIGCGGSGPSGMIPAGSVKDVAEGALFAVTGEAVALGRDSGGLYAMTLICTHAGCDMATRGSVSPMGVVCNCHGSNFDTQGNPVSGPAHSPLEHYAVTVDASGNITINADTTVDATVRTAVM